MFGCLASLENDTDFGGRKMSGQRDSEEVLVSGGALKRLHREGSI